MIPRQRARFVQIKGTTIRWWYTKGNAIWNSKGGCSIDDSNKNNNSDVSHSLVITKAEHNVIDSESFISEETSLAILEAKGDVHLSSDYYIINKQQSIAERGSIDVRT